MTTNLMNGKIIVGGDEIKTILIQCFKRDIKERIGSLRLLELVNLEINRLEAMGRLYRPLPVKRTEEVVASQFMPIMTNNGSPQVNQMKMAQPNQMKTNTFPALPSRGHIPSHPNIEPGRTRL